MNIALLEPFFSGSHQKWTEGLAEHSHHDIYLYSLPGRHWKWRMHGGAVQLADQFKEAEFRPDLILGTSMLDLTTFLALCREQVRDIPTAMYFHENQLSYPWSPGDPDPDQNRDHHYCFINYASALAADRCFFNSDYHKQSFLRHLEKFLQLFPDYQGLEKVELIRKKSEVLPLGMDLSGLKAYEDSEKEKNSLPVIVWNHRWEYDKNPEDFFQLLFSLKDRGNAFKLVVLGEQHNRYPEIFDKAKARLKEEILHWGYAESQEEYARWLYRADLYPVTSNQDFFGGSVVEAMYCNCFPLLPNRLAYPEHIPKKIRRDYLYEEGELLVRMESAIRDFMMLRQVDYRSMVQKYDWKKLAPRYDKALKSMLKD